MRPAKLFQNFPPPKRDPKFCIFPQLLKPQPRWKNAKRPPGHLMPRLCHGPRGRVKGAKRRPGDTDQQTHVDGRTQNKEKRHGSSNGGAMRRTRVSAAGHHPRGIGDS
eukprot:scaffold130207_cov72-Phaeocystis_antarctica.AAC.2